MLDNYCCEMDKLGDTVEITAFRYKMGLDYCERMQKVKAGGALSPAVAKCVEHISRNLLAPPPPIEELADAVGLSPRVLSKRFRGETGFTIPDYIHRGKIEEAKNMLRYTDRGIADISGSLGYSTMSFFAQKFKQITGLSPSAYRRQCSAP
jgi:AraC-like DNA-binding protein